MSGVEHKKISCVRHTFVTLMLKKKIVSVISVNELAGLLGHAKPKTTFEHYASVIDSRKVNLGKDFSLVRYSFGQRSFKRPKIGTFAKKVQR